MKETTKYDNCLDVKATDEMNSLTNYLDLSEEEKKSLEEDDKNGRSSGKVCQSMSKKIIHHLRN